MIIIYLFHKTQNCLEKSQSAKILIKSVIHKIILEWNKQIIYSLVDIPSYCDDAYAHKNNFDDKAI
jgi:hypothetical protein